MRRSGCHQNGEGLGGFCALGTFSDHTVVSEYSYVRIDDDVPFEVASKLGATHTATGVEEARDVLFGRTHGQMADLAVITVGELEPNTTVDAVGLIGKAGRVVVTSVSRADEKSISLTGSPMVGFHKRIQGSLAGGSNPIFEMPNLIGLYKSGHLRPDEIITRRHSLEQVNEGYRDLLAGKSIRGVVIHEG
jgi:alcohol dehydrogenase (nicotinoprotein)